MVTSTNALLTGLYLISTVLGFLLYVIADTIVSMPSRAYTSFLQGGDVYVFINDNIVSMPSRAYTSFLQVSR